MNVIMKTRKKHSEKLWLVTLNIAHSTNCACKPVCCVHEVTNCCKLLNLNMFLQPFTSPKLPPF